MVHVLIELNRILSPDSGVVDTFAIADEADASPQDRLWSDAELFAAMAKIHERVKRTRGGPTVDARCNRTCVGALRVLARGCTADVHETTGEPTAL